MREHWVRNSLGGLPEPGGNVKTWLQMQQQQQQKHYNSAWKNMICAFEEWIQTVQSLKWWWEEQLVCSGGEHPGQEVTMGCLPFSHWCSLRDYSKTLHLSLFLAHKDIKLVWDDFLSKILPKVLSWKSQLFTLLLSMSILFSRLRKPFTRLLTAMKKPWQVIFFKLNICYITCSSEEPSDKWIKYFGLCHVTISSYLTNMCWISCHWCLVSAPTPQVLGYPKI